jgi:hypothetical protein
MFLPSLKKNYETGIGAYNSLEGSQKSGHVAVKS